MQRKQQNGNSCAPWPAHPLFAAEAKSAYDAGAPQKGLRTVSIRRPGQKGTLDALREYGERLVCVRYLKDGVRGKRYKTVEIIVHEEDWTPPTKERRKAKAPGLASIVSLRIAWAETALREKVWAAGGRWDRATKVWRIRYQTACELGLEPRIINLDGMNPERDPP